MKKILQTLRKYDHLWGLPIAVLILIGGNTLANHFFNDPLISTEYLSPLFLTACVITFLHAVALFGVYLNHKSVFKAYNREESFLYFSPREKVFLYIGFYLFYIIIGLVVFFFTNNLMFQ